MNIASAETQKCHISGMPCDARDSVMHNLIIASNCVSSRLANALEIGAAFNWKGDSDVADHRRDL